MNMRETAATFTPSRFMKVVAGLAVILALQGCGYLHHQGTPHPISITKADAERVHPRSQYVRQHRHLTGDESARINERLGQAVTHPGELIAYYAVTPHPKRGTGSSGHLFMETVEGPQALVQFIISVHSGKVQQVSVRNGKGADGMVPEFLGQFGGRSLSDSFEVGSSPEVFHKIPPPLIPLAGNVEFSGRIAEAVKKVLVLDEVLVDK